MHSLTLTHTHTDITHHSDITYHVHSQITRTHTYFCTHSHSHTPPITHRSHILHLRRTLSHPTLVTLAPTISNAHNKKTMQHRNLCRWSRLQYSLSCTDTRKSPRCCSSQRYHRSELYSTGTRPYLQTGSTVYLEDRTVKSVMMPHNLTTVAFMYKRDKKRNFIDHYFVDR